MKSHTFRSPCNCPKPKSKILIYSYFLKNNFLFNFTSAYGLCGQGLKCFHSQYFCIPYTLVDDICISFTFFKQYFKTLLKTVKLLFITSSLFLKDCSAFVIDAR